MLPPRWDKPEAWRNYARRLFARQVISEYYFATPGTPGQNETEVCMHDYNPDHFATPRQSGLRPHHFRRDDDRDAMRARHVALVAALAIIAVAAMIALGGW